MTPEEFEKKREEARAALERGFVPKIPETPKTSDAIKTPDVSLPTSGVTGLDPKEVERVKKILEEKKRMGPKPPEPKPIESKPEEVKAPEPEIKVETPVPKQTILHTLKSDLASTIHDRNLSVTQIAMEEQARRAERPMEQVVETGKKTLVIVAISILILLGVGASIFTYYYINRDQGGNQVKTTSLLPVDVIKPFKIGDVKIEVSRQDIPINTVEELAFGFASPSVFFDELGVAPPGRLVRFLNKEFLVGIHSFDGPSTFLLFTTDDFQTTFAGMLDWEPKMLSNLGLFFPLRGTSTTTAYIWRDRVIKNIDTRVLTDQTGNMRLLWLFMDKSTLLITDKESTFSEVLRRFKTPR